MHMVKRRQDINDRETTITVFMDEQPTRSKKPYKDYADFKEQRREALVK